MTITVDVNSPNPPTSTPAAPHSDGVAIETLQPILTVEEIQKLLPHRYPFLLVDRIVEYVAGERAVGIKNITCNEPYFQGHFPGKPIVPGVLIVEAMAQVCGVVLTQMLESDRGLFLFVGINKVRFRRQVVPGDRLVMTVGLMSVKQRRFAKMQARAEVDGKLATEGELSFSLLAN